MNGHRQSAYWKLYNQASYYTWRACKGFLPTGSQPFTGKNWSVHDSFHRRLGRAANIAKAKVCLDAARKYRNGTYLG